MELKFPGWAKALPIVVLVPPAVIPNGSLVSVLIVVVSLCFLPACRAPTLALRNGSWMRNILSGIAAGAVLWLLFGLLIDPLLVHWFGPISLGGYEAVKGNLRAFLALLALGILFGGILEEVIFRGFVIGWGVVLLGERAAIPLLLLSAVTFGGAHAYYQGLSGGISTGLNGLAFGLIYLAAGRRLLPAILAHATLDVIGVTALYLGYGS